MAPPGEPSPDEGTTAGRLAGLTPVSTVPSRGASGGGRRVVPDRGRGDLGAHRTLGIGEVLDGGRGPAAGAAQRRLHPLRRHGSDRTGRTGAAGAAPAVPTGAAGSVRVAQSAADRWR